MIASIHPAEWLRFVEQEYFSSFIREGGCAIKFAVPLDDALRPILFDGLAALGEKAGYLVARIDAAETKVHMIDAIFFRTAEQIPWRALSKKVIARLALESGYAWVDAEDGALLHRLAEENRVDPQMLLLDLKKAIWNHVFQQSHLSKDFRVAMIHLCLAELSGGPDGAMTSKTIVDWLMGSNKSASAVKPYQILRRVNRTTARHLFESLVHWLRLAGYPGIVILLDAQRVMLARDPERQGLFYSKAAMLDAYEVLRQFIDGSGHLEGCFLAVVPDIAFLVDHNRGISAYEALKFRIFDEIRDTNLVNPMASLARISAAASGN
ncbi:MAG TPA: BREX system ATP-binding domain-containing protein [Bryobacteraceae bacterium]|nr:BREX system ATP-binding domain-containing protein [Bryobacteraceae bacterium]